jgi:hypothetical protein
MYAQNKRSTLWNGMTGGALLLAATIAFIVACTEFECAQAQRTGTLTYTGWGVDEYELFGLTASEIEKRFGKWGSVSQNGEVFTFFNITSASPCFLLKYNHGKVSSVRRQFTAQLDGYVDKGPQLQSKEEALEYFINTISACKHLDQNCALRLADAKRILAELRSKETKEATQTSGTQHPNASPAKHKAQLLSAPAP